MTWLGRPRPVETVVADPPWVPVLVWLLLPAAGAALGWLVLPAAGWLGEREWMPLPGAVDAAARLPLGWGRPVAAAIGLLGGVLLAAEAVSDSLRVVVRPDRATLRRKDTGTGVARPAVAAVFVDGGWLVALDAAGREVVRVKSDQSRTRLAAAFTEQGWPWRDGDPYASAYRRWVPGLPDLPPGADALLAARERALRRDDGGDAEALRAELSRLGVVVRDQDKRQHWRRTADPR
jgi:hypothetical protein